MAEAGRDLDLAEEAVVADVDVELGPDHLDRDVAVMLGVARAVHVRHPAAADLGSGAVAPAEELGDGGSRRIGHSVGHMEKVGRDKWRSHPLAPDEGRG